jgi:hypothetical protein
MTCSFLNDAAVAGTLSPEICAYIARFDEECSCPQFPDDDHKVFCTICPDGVEAENPNSYVFCVILLMKMGISSHLFNFFCLLPFFFFLRLQ